MKLAMIALLVHPILILGPSGLFAATELGNGGREPIPARTASARSSTSTRPRRRTTARRSTVSASPTASTTTPIPSPQAVPWDIGTGLVMLFSRYLPIIAPIAMAFYLGRKKAAPATLGTMSDDTFDVRLPAARAR